MINDTRSVRRAAIHRKTSSQPYWEATRERKLLLQYCPATGQYQFFPRPVSIATGRAELEWREVDGKGEIYSYSVTHRGPGPFVGQPPYAVVIARLDVGADVIANLVGCEMPEVRIGLRVKPCWFPLEDGTHLLQFQPDEAVGTETGSVNP